MPQTSPDPSWPRLTIAGKHVITVQRWTRRPATRGYLLLFCLIAGIAAMLFPAPGLFVLFKFVLVLSAGLVVWPFFEGAYLLYTRLSIPAQKDYTQLDPSALEEFPQYWVFALRKMGFQFAACAERYPDSRNVRTRVAIFFRAGSFDNAQVGEIRGTLRTKQIVVFATRFDDGTVLETSNAHGLSIFRPKAQFRTYRFSTIRDLSSLYLVHQRLKKQLAVDCQPVHLDPAAELEIYQQNAAKIHSLNLSQGDYRLVKDGTRYRYNLKGAFRHAFLSTWPISALRHIAAERRAYRICEELGLYLDPKLGRVIERK